MVEGRERAGGEARAAQKGNRRSRRVFLFLSLRYVERDDKAAQ
jgi:hypothetical protein